MDVTQGFSKQLLYIIGGVPLVPVLGCEVRVLATLKMPHCLGKGLGLRIVYNTVDRHRIYPERYGKGGIGGGKRRGGKEEAG